MGHFIAFVLDLCCTAPNCNKETFIEIKKQIDEYLDNIIKKCEWKNPAEGLMVKG